MKNKTVSLLSDMWRRAREDAGFSQEHLAKALGVSKSTIQNWEAGITSPSHDMGFEIFHILGLQPLPYYLQVIYPDTYNIEKMSSDTGIENMLHALIRDLPPEERRKLLYVLAGNHGSSSLAIIDMVTAHLQTPLRDRLNVAQSIYINYEIAARSGNIQQPGKVQPNMDRLLAGIQLGKEAVLVGHGEYSILRKEDE